MSPDATAHADTCAWLDAGRQFAEHLRHVARLQEAQQFAAYAEGYAMLAIYHHLHEHDVRRVASCTSDAERCLRFAIALVLGPWPEMEP